MDCEGQYFLSLGNSLTLYCPAASTIELRHLMELFLAEVKSSDGASVSSSGFEPSVLQPNYNKSIVTIKQNHTKSTNSKLSNKQTTRKIHCEKRCNEDYIKLKFIRLILKNHSKMTTKKSIVDPKWRTVNVPRRSPEWRRKEFVYLLTQTLFETL